MHFPKLKITYYNGFFFSISLKLNFTSNTLGCFGLELGSDGESLDYFSSADLSGKIFRLLVRAPEVKYFTALTNLKEVAQPREVFIR